MTNFHDLFHQFFQVNRQFSKLMNEKLAPLGLYRSQWTIIYFLKQHGPSTQKEICEYLNVEAPTITRTVKRLEKSGWIERTTGKDKREKRIQLTEEAVDQFKQWQQTINTFELRVLDGVPEQAQKEFVNTLKKMNRNMKDKGD
ncbi:MAG TPA: MarR family transcriptional regulator [Bacillota bacterium]|nr:MarR family transcriptional regulator [Bacillota bacterium]